MTRLRASNDSLISDFINDSAYLIQLDGKIYREDEEAGRVDKDCYREIYYKGVRLKAHRIVYAKYCGRLRCDMVVDHKNRNRSDNQPDNLQLIACKTNNALRYRRARNDNARDSGTPIQTDSDHQRIPTDPIRDDSVAAEVTGGREDSPHL